MFSPAYDQMLSGSLALCIADDIDRGCFNFELAFGYVEDGTWGFGEVDTATYDFNVNTAFLEDGLFSVTLYSVLGDYYIDTSELRIEYEPVNSVPEPSTVAILGLGLMLLGVIQFVRHKAQSKFFHALAAFHEAATLLKFISHRFSRYGFMVRYLSAKLTNYYLIIDAY